MKTFDEHVFDASVCQRELAEFKSLLDSKGDLSERGDILPFFSKRPQLAAFIASYSPYFRRFDRIAFEYQLFGDFSCDLVVGDSATGVYCFVEFEDARAGSIFEKKGSKATPEWSKRFDHGFSQIIDWFCKLDDEKSSVDYRNRFLKSDIRYQGMLVVGRDAKLEYREIHRLNWRLEKVLIDSRQVFCVTFDELYRDLQERLESYVAIARANT